MGQGETEDGGPGSLVLPVVEDKEGPSTSSPSWPQVPTGEGQGGESGEVEGNSFCGISGGVLQQSTMGTHTTHEGGRLRGSVQRVGGREKDDRIQLHFPWAFLNRTLQHVLHTDTDTDTDMDTEMGREGSAQRLHLWWQRAEGVLENVRLQEFQNHPCTPAPQANGEFRRWHR